MQIIDKVGDAYFCQLNELTENDYKEDTKKIEQNFKVLHILVDMLDEVSEFQDAADQIRSAICSCSHAAEVRAYKMGLAFGQATARG